MGTDLLKGLGRKSEDLLTALRQQLDCGAFAAGGRMPTGQELCRQYGASPSTVRRAMARLVRDGRVVRRRGSGTFVRGGVAVSGRVSRTISVMFPFDRPELKMVQQSALHKGYLISPYIQDNWDPRQERAFLERVLEERHWALLALCTPRLPRNDDLLAQLDAAGVRVLHLEHYRENLPDESYILPDYRWGTFLAVSKLLVAGYQHLHFVGMSSDGPYATLAREGFAQALRTYCPGVDPDRCFFDFPCGAGEDGAAQLAQALDCVLVRGAAFICRSVDSAEILCRTISARGLRVPEDVGIVGMTHLIDVPAGGCDVIDYPWAQMLQQAVTQVLEPQWRGVRKLVEPILAARGTVRSAINPAAGG